MKITVDGTFTAVSQVKQVKADIKEFNSRYTAGDLRRFFVDAVQGAECRGSERFNAACHIDVCDILNATGEAFPGGYDFNNETCFSINMVLDGNGKIYKIHFYISLSGEVDTRAFCAHGESGYMYSIKEYKLANEF